MRLIAVSAAAIMVASCAHQDVHEHMFLPGIVPTVETDVEARSMCSAVAYVEDRDRMLHAASQMRQLIMTDATESANEASDRQSRRSPSAYGDPSAEFVDGTLYMVAQFEAELDGSYDAVVQNCRAYNQCMIRNDYVEGDCMQSASMWESSQVRFHQLADSLSRVRERVALACDDCGAPPPPAPRDEDQLAHGGGAGDHHGSGHHGSRHSGQIGAYSTGD